MSKPAPDLFSAPRRFDLFTMLVAAAAYAVLFTTLRLLNAPPSMMAFTGGLFTVVAIGQALGQGRMNPRRSSRIAAGAYWFVAALVMWAADRDFIGAVVNAGITSLFFGGIVGYLVGVLVAGVFLVSYYLREGVAARRGPAAVAHHDHDASPWDESAPAAAANHKSEDAAENQQTDGSS